LKDFQDAINCNPDDAEIYYNVGNVHLSD